MDEVIDLKPYINRISNRKLWLALSTAFAFLLTYGISSLIPEEYEAMALVSVINPQQELQFDSRIRNLAEVQSSRAYPELAKSDEILMQLLKEAEIFGVENINNLNNLYRATEAELGNDPSLLRLRVTTQNPTDASQLANIWAELFVEWVNSTYGSQNGSQIDFFTTQLEESELKLAAAEEAIISFKSIDQTNTISNTLNAYYETQSEYLKIQRSTSFLIDDISGFKAQLLLSSRDSNMSLSDQILALNLQARAYDAVGDNGLFFQLDNENNLTSETINEQILILDNLITMLQEELIRTQGKIDELEPEILTLQQQYEETQIENRRLARNLLIFEETYITLARKVEEEKISSQEISGGVRLTSQASVPQNPVSPRTLLNSIVAGFLTLTISILLLLIKEWWHQYYLESK